jgi:hypothetical protein
VVVVIIDVDLIIHVITQTDFQPQTFSKMMLFSTPMASTINIY